MAGLVDKGAYDDAGIPMEVEKHLSLVSASLEQWMEANDWWKDACRESETFCLKGPERTQTKYPTITKTAVLKEFANETEKKKV